MHCLERLHNEMHDMAQACLKKARMGLDVPAVELDAAHRAFSRFISQARRLERAFSQATSDLDPLTGLHNRQAMLRELAREQARIERTGSPACIALADLDHFKSVNDVFGHLAGDKVLRAAADRFLCAMRVYDGIFRYGGEEFLICLPETSLAEGMEVLERLRGKLESLPIALETGESLDITASFGVAPFEPGAVLDEVLEQADQALYSAKEQGRNRVCGWDGPADIDALPKGDEKKNCEAMFVEI